MFRIVLIIISVFLIINYNVKFINCHIQHEPDSNFIKMGRRALFGLYQTFQLLDERNFANKLQPIIPKSVPFFCDTKNGPSKRSTIRPTSINAVRAGDIDIIAAMGDSLTTGNGMVALNLLELAVENRGISWSIGGEADWRKYTTLPNILKNFNPKLYGYALNNSLSSERASRFNVAEGAAESHDMLYQAKVLKMRLENDPNVDMKNDWKMVTMYFGAIDICIHACHENNTIAEHEMDLVKVLRFMRDNIPRLIVNIVSIPNPRSVSIMNRTPFCVVVHAICCSCYTITAKENVKNADDIVVQWRAKDQEVIYRDEFHTNEFTVNYQPFAENLKVKALPDGMMDLQYFATDCLHFSQKFHAIIAIHLWNNLFEREGEKIRQIQFKRKPKCPTNQRPFIATRENSQN